MQKLCWLKHTAIRFLRFGGFILMYSSNMNSGIAMGTAATGSYPMASAPELPGSMPMPMMNGFNPFGFQMNPMMPMNSGAMLGVMMLFGMMMGMMMAMMRFFS